ncbi:MAG: bifunctional DNA-formamidopyrimidine glycosylase/DNA-(apurinic or apyrimidinic site) lyase [Gammaproteobacteria bacterium]|nr:bifunctional DNA-formamidopyrimidine glycosylase/DNA-(apurinic or apyrimidinic site) lyase [Gammaproteobacteria bacterium]
MPELPEVETTVRGIRPYLAGETIENIIIRERRLRWPISTTIDNLQGARIDDVYRRGKYILMPLASGTMIWHLGMSGSMRMLPVGSPVQKHEHVEMQMHSGQALKFRDPRRFGSLLFTEGEPLEHRLLAKLGPEPLSVEFDGDYFYKACKGRTASIKSVIMDSHRVVGVGNIYACEALFGASINPTRAAGSISKKRLHKLVETIKATLKSAIGQGGTTLQDFSQVDGKPGYFTQSLKVYGIKGPCSVCGKTIRQTTQNQRSSYFCPNCQR